VVDLRIEVEAFCQYKLVLKSGGWSSLPVVAGEREKVVAFLQVGACVLV